GVPVQVPLTDRFEHDLEAMAAAITERTRLILLCTPNNPTGPSLSTAQLEEFLAQVPDHVVVAIDEAYREFHDPETAAETARLFREHGNVALLRTFSKLQGMAGLRLGYAIAHPRLARALGQVTVPFGASVPAQAAALASLDETVAGQLDEPAAWIRGERARVVTALAEQGWPGCAWETRSPTAAWPGRWVRSRCPSGPACPHRPPRWRAWTRRSPASSTSGRPGSAGSGPGW